MKRLALAALLASLSATALADTVGTYLLASEGKSQTMTVSYKNDQSIRMDVGQGTYMLVSGAKVYMVTSQGGQTTVVDMDTLPKFAVPQGKATEAQGKAKVTKTGRTETIAGVKGDVWEIVADGQKHEAVISTDKRVQGLNKAFNALARRMGQALGGDSARQIELALAEAQKHGTGGLLRSDRNMVLQSVSERSLPSSHYQLPAGAKPMTMPAMPDMSKMPGMDPAAMKQMQQQMQQMMKQQGR